MQVEAIFESYRWTADKTLAAHFAYKSGGFELLKLERCGLVSWNRNAKLKVADSGRHFFDRPQPSPVLQDRIAVRVINSPKDISVQNGFA